MFTASKCRAALITGLLALLLAMTVAGVLAGCGSGAIGAALIGGEDALASSAPSPTPSSSAVPEPTMADVREFVDEAVAFAKANGREAACAAFTAAGGQFHRDGMYIFAYDFEGTVIAHGGNAALVGKNLLDMRDPNGVPVIEELVRLAKGGSGWLYYSWGDPAKGNEIQPKLGYVKKVDDTWFLGSGTYGAAAVKPPTKAEVKDFVEEAWAHVKKVGRKQAFKDFMDKNGSWIRGQQYIFADAFDGTVLCFPTEPDKVGTSLWDRTDVDGRHPIRMMCRLAQSKGSGWVTYKYLNPAQGNEVQRKYTFVKRGSGKWFLGSGTYRPID